MNNIISISLPIVLIPPYILIFDGFDACSILKSTIISVYIYILILIIIFKKKYRYKSPGDINI